MDVAGIFSWLFQTRTGVLCLLGGGIVLFLIIALVLELRTRSTYKDESAGWDDESKGDDWSLFGDDE